MDIFGHFLASFSQFLTIFDHFMAPFSNLWPIVLQSCTITCFAIIDFGLFPHNFWHFQLFSAKLQKKGFSETCKCKKLKIIFFHFSIFIEPML